MVQKEERRPFRGGDAGPLPAVRPTLYFPKLSLFYFSVINQDLISVVF